MLISEYKSCSWSTTATESFCYFYWYSTVVPLQRFGYPQYELSIEYMQLHTPSYVQTLVSLQTIYLVSHKSPITRVHFKQGPTDVYFTP